MALASKLYPYCTQLFGLGRRGAKVAKRANITNRLLERLDPQPQRYDVFDGTVRGFHIRVNPNGVMTYRFKYVAAGRQRVMTIGEHGSPWTADGARKRAEVLRGIVKAGGDPVAQAEAQRAAEAEELRRAITVKQLVERWLDEGPYAAPNKRATSWAHDASRLRRHIIPLLGNVPANALRRADIEKAQRDIRDGKTAIEEKSSKKRGLARVQGGPSIARGAIVSLSACYSWAVAQELVSANPVTNVKKIAAVKRERFLTDGETARLLDTVSAMESEHKLSSQHADTMRLLLLTGARKREISDLTWPEINLTHGVIVLPPDRSKTGAKTIPLNAPAAAILSERANANERLPKRKQSPFVFPAQLSRNIPAQGLQKAWERVRTRANLESVRLHDLRHSYASFAAAGGASMALIAKALGHTQVATTERYAHFGSDPVKQLAEKVGERIVGAQRAAKSNVVGLSGKHRRKADAG